MKVPMVLKNKYVLYVLLFIAIINILGYVALEEYNALALFTVLGLLTSYFSKNMSVNLLVAIVGTSLMVVNNKVQEGFTEAHDGIEKRLTPGKVKGKGGGKKRTHPLSLSSEQALQDDGSGEKALKMTQKAKDMLKRGLAADRSKKKVEEESQEEVEENPGAGKKPTPPFEGCSKGSSCPKGR